MKTFKKFVGSNKNSGVIPNKKKTDCPNCKGERWHGIKHSCFTNQGPTIK